MGKNSSVRNVLATLESEEVVYLEAFSVYNINNYIPNRAGDVHVTEEIIRADIYEMIKEAVNDGLAVVRQFEADGKLIYQHFQFPIMSQFPSGFPSFRKSFFMEDDIPLDYKSVFRREEHPPESIPSWQRFWNFAHQDESLSHFWEIGPHFKEKWYSPALPDLVEIHSRISVYGSIEKLVDRYIHVSGKKEMEEELFRPIYQEWERSIFWEKLPINIVVPILGLMVSSDRLEIGNDTTVERMGDLLQLARNDRSTYTVSTHDTVIGAATHSFVLRDWTIANKTFDQRREALNDIGGYAAVILKVEEFFAALRAETSVETGYSQIVVTPIGWADSWQAYLPHVNVVTVRAYPDHFEKHGWLRTPPTIDENTCGNIVEIFNAIKNAPDNRLVLAARRLNAAFLRAEEEDSILDVTMGLETLLTSDTRTEITYKLAMRAAALSTIEQFEELSPDDVFKHCKKVYDYRSDVIHGSKKVEKKRIIKLAEEKEISIVRLGVNILRYVIRALSHHLEYLDPEKLDKLLINRK